MKSTISWTWLATLLLCALATPPALAQGGPDAGTEAGTEAGTGHEAGTGTGNEAEAEAQTGTEPDAGVDAPPTEAASDAKRM
ncbi:MAG: hypothetical protein JRH14_05650, partial [Deltaproteobacteria bacterium]|nr:hypothetical protein [Deltaproteobacteria bacterium]